MEAILKNLLCSVWSRISLGKYHDALLSPAAPKNGYVVEENTQKMFNYFSCIVHCLRVSNLGYVAFMYSPMANRLDIKTIVIRWSTGFIEEAGFLSRFFIASEREPFPIV